MIALLLASVLAASSTFCHRVIIKNLSDNSITNVVVSVRGNKYELKEILPKQSRTILVHPTGESDVRIEYVDESSNNQVIDVGRYLEPNTWPEVISVNIPIGK